MKVNIIGNVRSMVKVFEKVSTQKVVEKTEKKLLLK